MRAWVWMLKAEAANKCLRPRMLGAFFRSISHGYFARETQFLWSFWFRFVASLRQKVADSEVNLSVSLVDAGET